MVTGVDTVSNIASIASTIKGKGHSFVIRYYSLEGNSKRMTTSESAAISNAGLKRIVVYQNKHNSYDKFSATIAATDASDAISQAKTHGQPSSVIYFAVDYDASASEIDANIKEHFKKLNSLITSAGYSLGVYGSSLVCKKLKEAGIVNYTWLAMSAGWGYGTSYTAWNIHQTKAVTISSINFDENEANSISSIGAW